MPTEELDQSYTALCQAMARVGEAKSPVFLAMLCLSMMARQPSAGSALALIQQAEQQCL